MSESVTGEAVVLDLRLARPATRALALGIDLLLELILFGLLMIPVALVTGDDASESLIGGLVVACGVLTFVGYTTTIETLTRGKSVGKYALGLRVVRDDGGPVRFRHAFVRALCGVFVDFFVTSGCVGFLTAMLSPGGKRVGDMLAGTLVLRDRAPAAPSAVPEPPPGLEAWSARLELSTLPDQLALSVRSFLGRYHELTPAAREELGGQLATSVARYVAPAPPAGLPPWAYLAAVLAERRRRAFGDQPSPYRSPYAQQAYAQQSYAQQSYAQQSYAQQSAPPATQRQAAQQSAPPATQRQAAQQPATEQPAAPSAEEPPATGGFAPPR
ncbi:RDD family protein [Actinopolymorpha cephalotaxi]|uniref:RDD family membrane protein YckC n=1 Tax=Actinopolymorpha cephalotaxi TaxID=504797 RepID=A0ABX2S655_9ACTN|nr:RDD family protein [Actinopolymorpha cephalotaxi]NYH84523.1 putative RDD family membrane protein YckC [Actinopolymorpha cephalotaxi]